MESVKIGIGIKLKGGVSKGTMMVEVGVEVVVVEVVAEIVMIDILEAHQSRQGFICKTFPILLMRCSQGSP